MMRPDEIKVVRDIIAQFVENAGADSVVVVWSTNHKAGTKAKISTWGNQFACRDMIRQANDDYVIERLNKIKRQAKDEKNP